MKKHLPCVLIFYCSSAVAVAQTPPVPVTSPNTRYQLEREVMTRWGKFNPKWYFILFHNKYRQGEDRRNMKQLLPLMATLRLNSGEAEIQDQDVTEIRDQELFKMADRSLNKSWHLLYERKVNNLHTRIALLHAKAIVAGVEVDMLLAFKAEQERINADIQLTKEAYQDDAKKAERFRVALDDLTTLRGYYQRIITFYNTSKNFLNNKNQ